MVDRNMIQRHRLRRLNLEALEARIVLDGFTAYNGLFSSANTDSNTTFYTDQSGSDASGLLRDVATGLDTGVLLSTNAVGINYGGNASQPAFGTDAHAIFNGFVDFSAGGPKSIEIESSDSYEYTFENLDPGATYELAGSAVRGNAAYTDRWTLVQIVGADSFTPAHSVADGVITDGLPANQVAIWFGNNSASNQGFVAQWHDIDPGADGEFQLLSTQYRGAVPTSIDSGGVANGSKGYGIAGIRLIENVPSGPPAIENTPADNVLAFEAEVGGQITGTGGEVPNVTLYYGTSNGGTTPAAWCESIDLGGQTSTFSTVLSGLDQDTTYFYRTFAENSVGSAWAPNTESFSTLTASSPTVINLPASTIGAFAATLNGQITDTGNASPIVTIYYGANDAGTNTASWDQSIELGAQSGAFAAPAIDLEPLTTYYFRAYAQNSVGGSWGSPSQSFTTTDTPPLQITEFMADNANTLFTRTRDDSSDPFVGDNQSPDWIEVHNPTAVEADLGGYHLTDNLNNLTKWEIPAGTTIPAGGFTIFLASGEDITDSSLDENGYLHTGFRLNDGGEDLALTDADGVPIFSYEGFPVQSEDISYGIDAAGIERTFAVPTPGLDNANDTPRSPRFSVDSSTFTGSFDLELTSGFVTDTIRYTLDETSPTITSPVYTGPLTISNTTMVRAISVGANGKLSTVSSESYIELGATVANQTSDLPIVVVETFGDGVGNSFRDMFIGIIEPGSDNRSHLDSPYSLQTRAAMRIRGSSSSGFAKKQYRVEFRDENDEDRKLGPVGLSDEADWIFYGPSQYDRVLISNPLMYDLSNQIGRYATRTRWVEMYLNANGGQLNQSDYVGVYAIIEVIERGEDRVDVEELSSGAGGQPVEGGFIWKNDRGSAYVDPENITTAQRNYIDGVINDLEAAAAGPNFTDPVLGYEGFSEVDAMVDHNILNMLAMNVDAMRLSSFYFKTAEGKLAAGPIWDFDRSLDSTDGRDNNPRTWFGTGDSTRYFNDNDRVMSWWSDMFRDPDFVQLYVDRWFELRNGAFSFDNLYATIDSHAAEISESAARDYNRWSGSRYGDFAGEISHLKDWLTARVNWIDSQWLAAPVASTSGPMVAPGTGVTLTSPVGQVYYTLDGSDPRGDGGSISPTAIAATGPITIDAFTQITARVFLNNHGPTNQGYIPSGDDWSAPMSAVYFTDAAADATNLRITELDYRPHGALTQFGELDVDNDLFEFIELTNVSDSPINLAGVQLVDVQQDGNSDGVSFTFNAETVAPGQSVVVVRDVAAFESRHGSGLSVVGTYTGGLDNGGERITLLDIHGDIIQQFEYDDSGDWPERPDGNGSSLEVIDTDGDYEDPDNWRSSIDFAGSPGTVGRDRDDRVLVNEVLARSDAPLFDTIELANTTGSPIDVGYWHLTDSNENYFKFRLAPGLMLPADGYLVFDERLFNSGNNTEDFGLSRFGDDVWLVAGDVNGPTHFVDDIHFSATLNQTSLGRLPNAGPDAKLVPLANRSFGSANTAHRVGELIVSEVHYNPTGADTGFEFIELYNNTGSAIDLSLWRIDGAVDFALPAMNLAAGSTVVLVDFDPAVQPQSDAAFRAAYGISDNVTLLGPWQTGDVLDNGGEWLRVEQQNDDLQSGATSFEYVLIDSVDYNDENGWPVSPDGAGDSLQRIMADAFGDAPTSWTAAPPTPGSVNFGPGIPGDFNNDGIVNATDIDLLFAAVNSGQNSSAFDLTADSLVDMDDLDQLILVILGSLYGDANLDTVVDTSDFNRWNSNKFTNTAGWANGDFNGDGAVDTSDFNIWNGNKFTAGAGPVPQSMLSNYKFDVLYAVGASNTFRMDSHSSSRTELDFDGISIPTTATLIESPIPLQSDHWHENFVFAYDTLQRGHRTDWYLPSRNTRLLDSDRCQLADIVFQRSHQLATMNERDLLRQEC